MEQPIESQTSDSSGLAQLLAKAGGTARPLSPPPAYAPTSREADLRAMTARQFEVARVMAPQTADQMPLGALLSSSAGGGGDEAAEWSDEGLSAISLRINTSVTVTSNNNIVCLMETPAKHADVIAQAVVQTLRENSSGQCGIPMIDEEGRPRPLRIHVDASFAVEGAGNVVGSEAVVAQVVRQRRRASATEARRARNLVNDDDDEEPHQGRTKRRRCGQVTSSSDGPGTAGHWGKITHRGRLCVQMTARSAGKQRGSWGRRGRD